MSAYENVRGLWLPGNWPSAGGGGFAAGKTTALTHRFRGQWGTPDAEMRFDLPTIRARSRQMANTPVLSSFITVIINNVLGPLGVNFQMKVKTSKAFGDGTEGQSDKGANNIIENAYRLATNKDNYLVSRDMTKRLADELKLRSIVFDGEVFIRTWKPFENEAGMARQLIDPDLCDINHNIPELPDGGQIRMGVQFDKFFARTGYWFLKKHPLDYQYPYGMQPPREFVPASEIRHLFIPLRPGQSRGLPLTTPALLSIRQLEAFVDAAVVNARVGAARNVFYEKQFPTGWTAQDGLVVAGDKGTIYEDLREGETPELPYGVTAKTLDTRFPDAAIEPFTKTAMRFNAMGLGTSYMTLSGDLSEANFSSLRAGLNEERSTWARWQQFFIESDCEPDFLDFLKYGLATQAIRLPASKRQKFSSYTFTGRRWSSVNPLQDAQADDAEIAGLRKSPQECIRARGRDPEEVLDEIAEFRDMAEERNLNGEDTKLANTAHGGPAGAKAGDSGQVDPSIPDDGGTNGGKDTSDPEAIKREMDAYGVGVRAGTLTPSKPDEAFFRTKLKIPPMTKEAAAAWDEDGGVRRPITLTPPETEPVVPTSPKPIPQPKV